MEIESIKQGLQWEGTHYCSTPPTEADPSTNTRQVPRGVVEVAVRFLQLAPIQGRRTSLGVAPSGLTRYRVCCSSTWPSSCLSYTRSPGLVESQCFINRRPLKPVLLRSIDYCTLCLKDRPPLHPLQTLSQSFPLL